MQQYPNLSHDGTKQQIEHFTIGALTGLFMEGIPLQNFMSQGDYDDVVLRAQIVGNRRLYSSPMFTEGEDKVCKNLTALIAESVLK